MHKTASTPEAEDGWLAFWIISVVTRILYTCYWDLVMDWGVLRRDVKHWRLRKDIMYPVWVSTLLLSFHEISRPPDPSNARRRLG